jgi:prepilin-type processing-associated H-X9-DG protein
MTMFAADGLHGTPGTEIGTYGAFTLENIFKQTTTMADALNGQSGPSNSYNPNIIAADPASFDKKRHQGKINVAFCDGHVECRDISTKDLSKVFLLAP